MSSNLVEMIRRHHGVAAPTALEVLKEAVEDHGEVTDEDGRRPAALTGLPEAAISGVATFCHSSPAVRDRDVIDARADAVAHVLGGGSRVAVELILLSPGSNASGTSGRADHQASEPGPRLRKGKHR